MTEPDIRTRILLAAKTLFAKHGFDGTTVRQVCEEAGANVALVSYHFGGKENLFSALFDEFFPNVDDALEQYRDILAQPETGLALFIEQVMLFKLNDPDMGNILEQEILMHSPRLQAIQDRTFPIWSKLRDLMLDGRSQGKFHFLSIDTTLLLVLGSLLFHKRNYYFRPLLLEEPQPPEAAIAATVEYVYGALGAAHLVPERYRHGTRGDCQHNAESIE
ncbi:MULTISPECIES: TetR/AcrR family transcriptional regulator [unclassified Paenibacillus]|uniref:TetR/AcrR family transcriptional regulator n=1 Tax=unclassified Paenibacillus TaxID=185978 RepID=UPI000BA52135|nr:TetR/AcrR family transcriptional regulator [Paenibacillus sp. 7541]PAK50334.1 hypothetical protein CHH75_18475 [Paenibacillus sp. 7541]